MTTRDLIRKRTDRAGGVPAVGRAARARGGKFELSRGRVTRDMIWDLQTSRAGVHQHSRELTAAVWIESSSTSGLPTSRCRHPLGVRSPDVVVDRGSNPRVPRALHSPRRSSSLRFFRRPPPARTSREAQGVHRDRYSADLPDLLPGRAARVGLGSARLTDHGHRCRSELVGRVGSIALGGLGVELAMAAIFRGIPDAPTVE